MFFSALGSLHDTRVFEIGPCPKTGTWPVMVDRFDPIHHIPTHSFKESPTETGQPSANHKQLFGLHYLLAPRTTPTIPYSESEY